MTSFTVVTGKERYEITDLVTGGVNWAETKREMLMYIYYLASRVGHSVKVEDRKENAVTYHHI